MPEPLEKLRPDGDLQCYFERPSAIAALSGASATGLTISGTWRQQFDWAVLEWNRDNVFEHPLMRNLPDGDLSGLVLTYDETRSNCIPIDSNLFATVDWPSLRVWAVSGGTETLYKVPLKANAAPIEGSYAPAYADFTLQGTLTPGDYVGLSWFEEQYNHQVTGTDTLESAAQAVVDAINSFSTTMDATRTGSQIRLIYVGAGQTQQNSTTGANGNRIGAYGFVSGAQTEQWSPQWAVFSGGTSPTKWRVTLDFTNLRDANNVLIPTTNVRKMRWTYAAELQAGSYQRSEFSVIVTNWQVSGTNRAYKVAGAGSQRVEDDSKQVTYSGTWTSSIGNFSGGSIRFCQTSGDAVTASYACSTSHTLYLGTRFAENGAAISVSINSQAPISINLALPGEDVLVRAKVADLPAGSYSIVIAHAGPSGKYFYFDFLEAAVAVTSLPELPVEPKITLATDWDTDHSISLAPERTAWNIYRLGFRGRVNHYVGALWFYELYSQGNVYASATVTFTGTPVFSAITEITINRVGQPPESAAVFQHVNRIGDTAETIARAFALIINSGYTAIRAEVSGNVLTIFSRTMGSDGNQVTISAGPTSGPFVAQASGATFAGGSDGQWRTDLAAVPRLNRAVRDWSRGFFAAISGYGLDAASAFSMELQHGDPSVAAGIAQRYPSGNPVVLNTPAIQTNFSPASIAYWQQVYLEMAALMHQGGLTPYLQFGEVQWWYFPYDSSGLPFHDAYTKNTFLATYGFDIRAIPDGNADPAVYWQEAEFLPGLIGTFTSQVINYVRATYPACRFEVLYPTDVNAEQFNRVINYPSYWSTSNLDCLKTESFSYTSSRDLNKAENTIQFSATQGFPRSKRSHLVGIGDAIAPWLKEVRLALADGLESVVLFALDQFCLVGYRTPLESSSRRSSKMG
jgi:hypothetical protein